MIPADTKPGTTVYQIEYDHEIAWIWFSERVVEEMRKTQEFGTLYAAFRGTSIGGFLNECFLTRKQAAAHCLKQHAEVLAELHGQMAKMIAVLNEEEDANGPQPDASPGGDIQGAGPQADGPQPE